VAVARETLSRDDRRRRRMTMARPNEDSTASESSELWNLERFQELWLREADRWDGTGARFGDAMLDVARLTPGERVLDVGCGHGTTTLEAARRVAPEGAAVGVDVTAPLLARARERAVEAGVDNVGFLEGDAQVYPFEDGAFDAVISRFGTMFFEDPEAAFANLGRAVRPGGRLAIVCWQGPLESEWIAVAAGVAVAHFGTPPDLGPPGAPGPFAFADGDRLRRVIEAGGFGDVTIEAVTRSMRMGDDVDDVVELITSLDQTKALFAGQPAGKVAAAVDALRQGFSPYDGPDGVVMNGTAWLASAGR
jgi:SAM-dependent methyltransferase